MSLDIFTKNNELDLNITHNLSDMAQAAGYYDYIWHPDTLYNKVTTSVIVPHLEEFLLELLRNKAKYEKYNASNGWGTYKDFVGFLTDYISLCYEYPDEELTISR